MGDSFPICPDCKTSCCPPEDEGQIIQGRYVCGTCIIARLRAELFYALDRLDWAYKDHDERYLKSRTKGMGETMRCEMCRIRDRLRAILNDEDPGQLPQRIKDAIKNGG